MLTIGSRSNSFYRGHDKSVNTRLASPRKRKINETKKLKERGKLKAGSYPTLFIMQPAGVLCVDG